ncbi:hypothetical protein J3E64_003924 [Sphingobium sp. OAS761]|uniref:hypothetical protein n=1 Tax=Sphingobium sp. OAS761 TaxID=2817901 RepID=UPI0020A1A21D|nr:hypothetical protein [Sphingobium sp. OAS761]MCP1472206.1 hypothetical protein [Sphingobium sp. OAS761]
MSITSIFADMPTGVIVVIALIAAALAVRFRGIVSLAFAAFCLFGSWNAGDAQPVLLALGMGIASYAILSVVGGIFGGKAPDDDVPDRGFDHDAEYARLIEQHHRREREGRF